MISVTGTHDSLVAAARPRAAHPRQRRTHVYRSCVVREVALFESNEGRIRFKAFC